MECINCKENTANVFFIEKYPCKNCGDFVEITNWLCKSCYAAWQSIDGTPIASSVFNKDLIETMFGGDLESFFDLLDTEGPIKLDTITTKKKDSMIDCVHHCLNCGELCFEQNGVYRCPDCGTFWGTDKW